MSHEIRHLSDLRFTFRVASRKIIEFDSCGIAGDVGPAEQEMTHVDNEGAVSNLAVNQYVYGGQHLSVYKNGSAEFY
jgi:hypothetical protein